MRKWKNREKEEPCDYEGADISDESRFEDGTVKINWDKIILSKDDTTGKVYINGETFLQSLEAEKTYDWLYDHSVKPEPEIKGITVDDYAKLEVEDNIAKRLIGRYRE